MKIIIDIPGTLEMFGSDDGEVLIIQHHPEVGAVVLSPAPLPPEKRGRGRPRKKLSPITASNEAPKTPLPPKKSSLAEIVASDEGWE